MTTAGAAFPVPAVKAPAFPPQIKHIVGNEVCERFSYYGMRAMLAVFMVSITGLEFAYTQAPRAMKSTIMSFFFGAAFFWFFAALMLCFSGVFTWSASRYKVREHLEDGTAPVGH